MPCETSLAATHTPFDFGQAVPLIPEQILRQHECFEPADTRFQSIARILQTLWRQERGLPVGRRRSRNGKSRRIGSRLNQVAGRAGRNFLSPSIASLVRREVAYREIGAAIETDRLYHNLLSSMPLVFNLFAVLKLDMPLASRVFASVLPGFTGTVTQILFEHSPGRGNPLFTADFTAFDVLIRYRTADGKRGFLAIEQKYSEAMMEPSAKTRGRYDELSEISAMFIDPRDKSLRGSPFQQLWREHLLAFAMLDRKLYDEGTFVVIAPRLNWHVQNAVAAYGQRLNPAVDNVPGFIGITLERFIEGIAISGQPEFAADLYQRYCDFARIDKLIDAFIEAETPDGPMSINSDDLDHDRSTSEAA